MRFALGFTAFGMVCATALSLTLLHAQTPKTTKLVKPGSARAVRLTDPALLPDAKEAQAVVSASGAAVYVTFGAGDVLYCTASQDGGKTFAPSVRITGAGTGHLSLGMRRGPRVALAGSSGKAVIVTAVYGRKGDGSDGDLFAWRSADGGKTWSRPVRVNDVPGAAREGLHAFVGSSNGKKLACAWLDLRGPEGSGTRLYTAFSHDGGATWEPNRLAYKSPDKSVCECCHPSLAWDESGKTVWLLFRNSVGGNRDMYLTATSDNGKTWRFAQKQGKGTWPLNACPMDGGGLAIGPAGGVQTVWRRDNDIFVCAPFGRGSTERRVGRGQQPWATQTKSGLAFTYLANGRPGTVRVVLPNQTEPLTLADNGNDPVLAASPHGSGPLIAAWTQNEANGKTAIYATPLLVKAN